MEINVVSGGYDTFQAAMYGTMPRGVMDVLASQYDRVSSSMSERGRRFQEKAKAVFDRVSSSDAVRIAQAATRKLRNVWNANEIRPLLEIGQIQHAPPVMQRWIMADPYIRKLYHENKCDGYSDTYVDLHPGQIGKDHYDWRRLNDGLVVFETDEDGNEIGWSATSYIEDLAEGDEDLTLSQKDDILDTQSVARAIQRMRRQDATSVRNANL
jgi:hypothetical protein